MGSPQKSEKSGVKGSVASSKAVNTIGLCVSRFSSEKICSKESEKMGIKSHTVKFSKGHVAPHKNSGKKGSIAGRHSKV